MITTAEVAQMTVVHVEDEVAFEYSLKPLFQRRGFHYERVSLLSEAWDFLGESGVVGFIIDLRLPPEAPSRFARWAGYEGTPAGLIEKIRVSYPELPVVVLTDYPDDSPLRHLLQAGILQPEDIFKKSDQRDEILEALVERFLKGRSAGFSRGKRRAKLPDPESAGPASAPLPANMDLRLLHLVEKARLGLLSRATASTRPGEIPVVARINDLVAWKQLPGLRPGIEIPRPGRREWTVTGRLQAGQAESVRRQPFVLSLEAAQLLAPQLIDTLKEVRADAMTSLLLDPEAGKGVVIGIVDAGCDFAHPNFRHGAGTGKTRILALWHQDAGNSKGPVGYGALYESSDLNAALAAPNPYRDYSVPQGSHGTHVMDIAAGGGAGTDGVAGIAPAADLVFVDLSEKASPWGAGTLEGSLMDSVHLLEAVEFIFAQAGDRPCVVNLSLGSELGAHDGTSPVEIGIDDLVAAAPNRAVVVAASNSYELGVHASNVVPRKGSADLLFQVKGGSCVILDLWYGNQDRFAAELFSPTDQSFGRVELGDSRSWPDPKGGLSMKLAHTAEHPDNGDNRVQLFLDAGSPPGVWKLRLHGVGVQDGRFHAWIEGDRGATPHSFLSPDPAYTLGCLACGRESIAVGAYNVHDKCQLCSFSSAGPTRDERRKPDVSAPGKRVFAARSRPLNKSKAMALSGTSMAAPVVSGIVAVLLAEAKARGISLRSHEIRKILRKASRLDPPKKAWHPRYGWGRIDTTEAILALRKKKSMPPGPGPKGSGP